MSSPLPGGTVTFLFTDIEASTKLLRQLGAETYGDLLADHRAILRAGFQNHRGLEVDTQGDAFFATFQRAAEALAAVVQIQRALAEQDWPPDAQVRVRMGLHTGEPRVQAEGYVGMDVHRAARIAHAAYGGQVLLSESTSALVRDDLEGGLGLLDLGEHRLKDLPRPERLYQLLIPGLPAEFPPLKSLEAHPNNLPASTTPLVGRVAELARLQDLLADPEVRLVTILGAGGMGKTRLALAAAGELHYRAEVGDPLDDRPFPDGVFFIPLESVAEAEGLPAAVAAGVGFEFFSGGHQLEQLKGYLRDKRLLLALDNFEHLLTGGAMVTDLLASAPELKVLTTSREKLNLRGETVFSLDGLNVVPAGENGGPSEALEFFIQSARLADPSFSPTPEEREAILGICRQLDGLPLGIELAAGWSEILTPGEIAAEIEQGLDFLASQRQDVPRRHQSLRAVFEYTWRLLSEEERQVLEGLAVFRGGFNRPAAQAVAGAGPQILLRLVNKSLLQRDLSAGRFMMHQMLREFAGQNLLESGRAQDVHAAHAHFFGQFMERQNTEILGKRQLGVLRDIELEFQNVKGAWSWAVEHQDFPILDQITDPLYVFCEWLNHYQEGEKSFQRLRADLAPRDGETPNATWGRALLPWYDLRTEGRGALDEGERLQIQTQAARSLAAAKRAGDSKWLAYAYVLAGAISDDQAEYGAAISCYRRALDLWPEIGDRYWVQIRLGLCCRKAGRVEEALLAFQGSLARGRANKDTVKTSWSLFNIGEMLLFQGQGLRSQDLTPIEARWREANQGFREIGSRSGITWTNTDLSLVAFLKGDFEEARGLSEETLALVEDFSLQAYGRREASSILAMTSLREGDYESGQKYLQDWLSTEPDMKKARRSSAVCRPVMMLMTLPALALLLAREGKLERAVELIALAAHHPANPFNLQASWPGLDEDLIHWQAALGREPFELAWEGGREADFDECVQEIKGLGLPMSG